MTYFTFLLLFLIFPLTVLLFGFYLRRGGGNRPPAAFDTWPIWAVLAGLVVIAVTYTTPWDNYLVATRVWWYNPDLVTGLTLGYVPIEEYTFFILQTILTGLVTYVLMSRLYRDHPLPDFEPDPKLRWRATAGVGIIWLLSTVLLLSGWAPATYLTLILSWALIPVLVQFAFGADILWHYRRLLVWGIVPLTLYLAAADTLAIYLGIWTISPEQTLNVLLGGILPLEEFTFFLMTNVLVVLGITLIMARESHRRVGTYQLKRAGGRGSASSSPPG